MSHKPLRPLWLFLAVGLTSLSTVANAQEFQRLRISSVDLTLGGVAVALYALPEFLHVNEPPASCGPCLRDGIPFFDRWAVADLRPDVSRVSDVLLIGLGAAALTDLTVSAHGLTVEAAAVGEAFALAVGLTQTLKALVGRKRPALFTETGGGGVVGDPANLRSFPSGHAAGAFAVATAYALARNRAAGASLSSGRNLAAFGMAAVVSGLRVAAGLHFPSDEFAGAAVGIGSALLVYEVRF